MSIQREMPISSFPRPLKPNLQRVLSQKFLSLEMPLLGGVRGWTGSGLTCWAEWGEPQRISWLGARTWSLAEAVILKLLLHKHNPHQSGLVAQESVTPIPLAEGSEGRACRSTQPHACTHTRVLYTENE